MSTRHVKKVYGSGSDALLLPEPGSEDESPISFSTPRRVVKNPYELLNEVSESEAKEDDGQAEDDDGNKSADASKIDDDTQAIKKKKKKKKAGRNKNKKINSVPDSEATEDESIVKSKSKQTKQQHVPTSRQSQMLAAGKGGYKDFGQLFEIETKFLNPEFELRKIFGSKVLNLDRGKRRQVHQVHRHKNLLVTPKDSWPSATLSGLSMQYLHQKDSFSYFKFCHSVNYQETQKNFIQAVDSLQPENVMAIMKSHPYHIDSHIQMSDMAKAAEDIQVATELVEMGLHGMESAFHTDFALNLPINRLEYKYQENRSFFVLLFKHLVYVGQRACYRTALELCKRLLTLDPDNDPLCALLIIDFYALKSGEFKWLTELCDYWEASKNLSQLPNFAYSRALAQYLLYLESSKEEKSVRSKKSDSYQQFGLNRLKPKVELEASELEVILSSSDSRLQYAILMFPSIVRPLLEKSNIQVESKLLNHSYFNAPTPANETRGLKLLCELYIWRTHHVWRDPRLVNWVEKNMRIALQSVDSKDPRIALFENKRKIRYQGTPRNVIRHVLLTDNKDLTINLPTDGTQPTTIFNYDPLPPADAVNIYSHTTRQPPPSNDRLGIFSILNSFFYEMGGNNQHQLQPEVMEAIQGADANPPIAVGAGIHQSVTALLDAMRELLTNAHEQANGEAGDDGDESEGDT